MYQLVSVWCYNATYPVRRDRNSSESPLGSQPCSCAPDSSLVHPLLLCRKKEEQRVEHRYVVVARLVARMDDLNIQKKGCQKRMHGCRFYKEKETGQLWPPPPLSKVHSGGKKTFWRKKKVQTALLLWWWGDGDLYVSSDQKLNELSAAVGFLGWQKQIRSES